MNYGNEIILNSFQQQDARGREEGKICNNKFDCIYIDVAGEQICAGDMVKLIDTNNKIMPTVAKVKATETYSADVMYGFIPLTRKKNVYNNGDVLTVCFEGVHLRMIAERYIGCGEVVYYDATSAATSSRIIFKNLDVNTIKAMGSGAITLFINGTKTAISIDFSDITTLADVVTKMSSITDCNCIINGNDSVILSTQATGANTSLTIDKTAQTEMYRVFNCDIAEEIQGQDAGANFGRVTPYIGTTAQGVVRCGIAKTSGGENELLTVIIK